MSTTKTTAHGADIVARWTVLHGAVILRQLTKTTAHGAKIFKTRTVSHGAVIVDSGGAYRGVMDEATRDALTYVYTGDNIIATDDSNQRTQHQYTGAQWVEGSEQRTPDAAPDHRVYFVGPVFWTNFTDEPDSYPQIASAGGTGSGFVTLAVNGPGFPGTGATPEAIELKDDGTTSTVILTADAISLNGSVTAGNLTVSVPKYVSGAGRVNGADTDFTSTPADGTAYTVRNSSDGKVYWTARANGAWKSVQLT